MLDNTRFSDSLLFRTQYVIYHICIQSSALLLNIQNYSNLNVYDALQALIFLGFQLVSEKKECNGNETKMCFITLDQCAWSCKNISSMFIFGRKYSDKCSEIGESCACFCESAYNGSCSGAQQYHPGYNLYRYTSQSSLREPPIVSRGKS